MQVKDNPNYHIRHCARAPTWGSGKTSMITRRAILVSRLKSSVIDFGNSFFDIMLI
jgi:hypothetical protein